MKRVDVLAPAKINLALHVTGQRSDGYHMLDSLVAFAPVGDLLTLGLGNTLSLTVEGPEAAGVPADMKNLALRAAALLAGEGGVALTLEKRLPPASGIGGGSSDAAAALRGMLAWIDEAQMAALAQGHDTALAPLAKDILALGADVPMCLFPSPLRARGIGEKITFHPLPTVPAVLVNPRIGVPTPAVFSRLRDKNNPPLPETIPDFEDAADLIRWLAEQRNDLQRPATEAEPQIAVALEALAATEGCGIARMSGSGATCFGLYADQSCATDASAKLRTAHPDWWIHATWIGDCVELAMPKVSEAATS